MAFRNFAIVSLVVLLIFFGCVEKAGPSVQETVQEITVVAVKPIQTEPCRSGNIVQNDECFLALSVKSNDAEVCKNIYSMDLLDKCRANFAADNLELCRSINDEGMRADCLSSNARKKNDSAVCDLIGNEGNRMACLKQVLPPCSAAFISDSSQLVLCIALDKSDYTLCNNDACFLAYAKKKGDADACGHIGIQADRFACLAIVKNSTAECNAIELVPVRSACVENAAEYLNDLNGCAFSEPGSSYSDKCYMHFAVERSDTGICRKLYTEEGRDECYVNYSIETKNTSACSKIINSLNQIGCYYRASVKNRMPSLCNLLENKVQRNDCSANGIMGEMGPVPSDCQNVMDEMWKNKCYYIAAKVGNDKSFCAFITPGYDKDSCDALFGISG